MLNGKTAIITGASQGLGKEIAKEYIAQACNIVICARSESDLHKAKYELQGLSGNDNTVLAVVADISKPEEVKILVESAINQYGRLDILVNNAGIVGPIGYAEEVDWSLWAHTLSVNLLGTMLMCRAVLSHFKAQAAGRIINLSGGGATGPLPRFSAYATSKAAVVRLTETIAEEVREFGITVNAVAPGAVNTRMFKETLSAGEELLGQKQYERLLNQDRDGGADARRAAALCVFLASEAAKLITGKLISAVWDPWQSLVQHEDDLVSKDIYTLRRILPADRSCHW